MNKYILGISALTAALCLMSCKNESKDASTQTEKKAKSGNRAMAPDDTAAMTDAVAFEEEKPELLTDGITITGEQDKDLAEIIKTMKAESDKWDEDQWKAAYRDALMALRPLLLETYDLEKQIEEARTEQEEAMLALKLMVKQQQYEALSEQMEEFGKICDANPTGNRLGHDEEFQHQVMTELGLDGIDF